MWTETKNQHFSQIFPMAQLKAKSLLSGGLSNTLCLRNVLLFAVEIVFVFKK